MMDLTCSANNENGSQIWGLHNETVIIIIIITVLLCGLPKLLRIIVMVQEVSASILKPIFTALISAVTCVRGLVDTCIAV